MKKIKHLFGAILPWIVIIAIAFFSIWLTKTIFETVINSDMPDWLKYILLK